MALPELFIRFRNGLLTNQKFLSFAQRFMLTRPVARAKSRDLFDLLAGFAYSQVLYACISLKLFDKVGLEGSTIAKLGAETGLSEARCKTLVQAAVALELLDQCGDTILLGQHGAALVAQPWIMRFVEHHRYFYRDLEDPVALLKGAQIKGGMRDYWSYENPAADKSEYSALMAASQLAVSEQILGAYDFSKHKRMLDVGGGAGAFLKSIGARYPHIERHVFDLAGVVSLIGPEHNIQTHSGDFRHTPLPGGMDLISLVRVLHDHDDAAVMALLKNIRSASSPNTTLLIAEPFAGEKATARVTDAYFNLYFTAMGQGRTRTPAEIDVLASGAGFTTARKWPTNLPLIAGVRTFTPQQ